MPEGAPERPLQALLGTWQRKPVRRGKNCSSGEQLNVMSAVRSVVFGCACVVPPGQRTVVRATCREN